MSTPPSPSPYDFNADADASADAAIAAVIAMAGATATAVVDSVADAADAVAVVTAMAGVAAPSQEQQEEDTTMTTTTVKKEEEDKEEEEEEKEHSVAAALDAFATDNTTATVTITPTDTAVVITTTTATTQSNSKPAAIVEEEGGDDEEEGIDPNRLSGCFVSVPDLQAVSPPPVKTVEVVSSSPTTRPSITPIIPPSPVCLTGPEYQGGTTTDYLGNKITSSSLTPVSVAKSPRKKSGHRKSKTEPNYPFIPAALDFAAELDVTTYIGGPHNTQTTKNNTTTNSKTIKRSGSISSQDTHNHHVVPHDGRIQLGICAMDKKARSKPMAEILSRLDEMLFRVVFFGDDLILNSPIEQWPANIDCLIAFYSKGYPLQKAKDYVKLRRPYCINDLGMQSKLQDRRKVYDLLEASGIDVPRHVFFSQDNYKSTGTGDGNKTGQTMVEEYDDHIEINGVTVQKPFVEKPVDADDHNIAIYYPTSAGGGCKKLFRKIGNRSSEFYPDINEIRRDGSYVYEEFVETQGTDVKMYTVGPDYGHAEARKSPAVDGKVQRNADGKELRFPVILTLNEKEIARRIVLQFKQFVCGFDLLRVQEGHSVVSYCCDVNGFSFVKNSRKYYDDCAQILTEHMLAMLKPGQLIGFSTLDPLVTQVDDNESYMNPLQRVARMVGNRIGGTSSHNGNESDGEGSLGARSLGQLSTGVMSLDAADPTLLVEGAMPVRDLPRELISEPASLSEGNRDLSEDNLLYRSNSQKKMVHSKSRLSLCSTTVHQEELRCVIAVVRHGDRTPKEKLKLNTKEPIILQYFLDHSKKPKTKEEDEEWCATKDLKIKDKGPMILFLGAVREIIEKYEAKIAASSDGEEDDDKEETIANNKLLWKFQHMRNVLERWKFTGLNRKLQIKPRKFETDPETDKKIRCKEVQLILKWGGDLTMLGQNQAIKLGKQFRQEIYPDSPGGGILRLHSTFRHDMKIKTSDEGRVMKTAASFAKGLLELEGEIPPILVSLVHKEKGSMHMLDPSGDKDVKLELDECKEKLSNHLQQDIDWRMMTEEDKLRLVGPQQLTSLRDALAKIGNPRKILQKIYETMGTLIEELEEMLAGYGSDNDKANDTIPKVVSEEDGDAALPGVKLYKGETLLELTERWRFIYKRLYDKDTDTFDLTRIPDVLDNVRFDVLHNPHLGLTNILHQLYSNGKDMADVVVPQEYGTTIAQKRTVGIKVCSSLLDKIRYDLHIARTDNKTDMRYMINMDYSADLPINTMGRRIRTRLYFTSESHLHTLINVLRFAAEGPECDSTSSYKEGEYFTSPVLSPSGMELLNESKEVCYLTHFVIRLFEDTGRKISDKKRFRVEILFSAGATGTPIHQAQSTKGADLTRIDTEPLVSVGRDGLTCADVEDFFSCVINEGGKGDDQYKVASSTSTSTSTTTEKKVGSTKKKATATPTINEYTTPEKNTVGSTTAISKDSITTTTAGAGTSTTIHPAEASSTTKDDTTTLGSSLISPPSSKEQTAMDKEFPTDSGATIRTTNKTTATGKSKTYDENKSSSVADLFVVSDTKTGGKKKEKEDDNNDDDDDVDVDDDDNDNEDNNDNKAVRGIYHHKYYYLSVATGTLLLGAGCLMLAMGLTRNSRGGGTYNRRHFTRR